MSLMDKFSDPSLIQSLSGGELALGTLMTAVMGMGITFVVLILLWGLITVMTRIMYKPAIAAMPAAKPQIAASAVSAPAISITDSAGNAVKDAQLIAAITAAIADYEAGASANSNLIVRRINRETGSSTAWSRAGNSDAIASRVRRVILLRD